MSDFRMSLHGKTAIITGSTKGIGKALAVGMARAGADIVVVSRHQDDCDAVAEEIRKLGVQSLGIAADIKDLEQITNLVNGALKVFKQIDILVNNAGSVINQKAEEITENEWDYIMNLDLKGVFFCSQLVGRVMIKQNRGKIINIASMLGLVGEKMVLPYCVSKGGVIQMTRALALEWARYNIQVNALCPGYIMTEMNYNQLSEEKIYQTLLRKTPLNRLGRVEDMIGGAVFLASESSNYMTGQTLTIDGGWTAW